MANRWHAELDERGRWFLSLRDEEGRLQAMPNDDKQVAHLYMGAVSEYWAHLWADFLNHPVAAELSQKMQDALLESEAPS